MKKYNSCLLALMVSVFLLLCACAQQQTSQASSEPDTLSSIPATHCPPPIYTPASSVPATSVPATSIPATSVPVTSVPATQPTTMPTPPATEPNLDWLTDREIIPFEDRFAEDVPFGVSDYWLDEYENYRGYGQYHFYPPYFDTQYGLYTVAEIVWTHSMETEYIYEVPIDHKLLIDFTEISVDGRWAYLCNGDELCKLELLTGELTTLVKKSEDIIYWNVQACGKDTVCIFQLDAQRNLRVYYRDLHSDAERTLYEGILPQSSPYDLTSEIRGLYFSAPSTTLGAFSWQMMNPAFYEAVQTELANPNSQFKQIYQQDYSKYWENPEEYQIHLATCPPLCNRIEDAYNIPYHIKYIYDPATGTLTEDYGIIDSCFYGTGQGCNHFDYEITKKETPEILDVTPVEIPNISKPTGDTPWEDVDDIGAYIYSDFGYGYPYFNLDDPIRKVADIAVTEIELAPEFIYCITTERTILQFEYYGTTCNTIYTSENELYDLVHGGDKLYFIDGSTIICIDTATGTWRPVIRTTLKEIYISRGCDDGFKFGVRQGLYGQEYRFYLDTGELSPQSYS